MFCANCGHATGIRKKADPAQYSEKVTVADHLNSDLLNKEEQPTIDKAKDSFKSLWNGDIPLCRAYWLYYVLGGMLIAFLTSILSTLFYEPFILKILNLITLGYAVFAGIGVWRSATKYSGSELWRYLAYIAVILTIIGAVLMFFAYASLLDLLYSY
jgi:hypothetical protein